MKFNLRFFGSGGSKSGISNKVTMKASNDIREAAKTWKPEINVTQVRAKLKTLSPEARNEYMQKIESDMMERYQTRSTFIAESLQKFLAEIKNTSSKYPTELVMRYKEVMERAKKKNKAVNAEDKKRLYKIKGYF